MPEAHPVLDKASLPPHIAIIMDGNGRWAQKRGKIRTAGHKEGLNTAKRIVRAASELGISFITLYAFSTENWKRAESEVAFLMNLIKIHLKKEYDFYRQNKIKVVHSGDIESLPKDVIAEIDSVTEDTKDHQGLTVNLAINYGGRDEIVRGLKRLLEKSPAGTFQLTEQMVRDSLDQPALPDPDLIIRTAGEKRLSNFLLWQCAYSEFYYSEKLWPDWQAEDLEEAVFQYQKRIRKYGGTK